jgi:hypothetical protein
VNLLGPTTSRTVIDIGPGVNSRLALTNQFNCCHALLSTSSQRLLANLNSNYRKSGLKRPPTLQKGYPYENNRAKPAICENAGLTVTASYFTQPPGVCRKPSDSNCAHRWRATNYFDDTPHVGVRTEETLYLKKVDKDFLWINSRKRAERTPKNRVLR